MGVDGFLEGKKQLLRLTTPSSKKPLAGNPGAAKDDKSGSRRSLFP